MAGLAGQKRIDGTAPGDVAPEPERPVDPHRTGLATRLILVLAIAFLAFVGGAVTQILQVEPVARYMRNTAMVFLYFYKSGFDEKALDPVWTLASLPGPKDGAPVVLNNREWAWRGVNLVLSADRQGAELIDMDGNRLHEWQRRFDEIWTDPPHVAAFEPEERETWVDKVHWRRAHLYPNGDILVVFGSPYNTPYGFGIAKLDSRSRVIWRFAENAHHDVAVAPDGRILTLTQRIVKEPYPRYPALRAAFIDDRVAMLDADGRKLQEVSIVEAFLNSDYAPFLYLLSKNLRGDAVHANTVQFIDEATAAQFPFAEPGQVLISMREMSTIAVLDMAERRIVWAITGLFRAQHEPQMLPNGRILVYDNKGHKGPGGPTRVIEIEPIAGEIEWTYAGTKRAPLFSAIFGSQQRLANGNTLIVESQNGRAIEVTQAGGIVWEYRSPHRKREGDREFVMLLTDLVRFDRDSLDFLD